MFGSIVLARALRREGNVPTAVAVGLPLAWAASIPLATLGGGVISGAYFLFIGYLLANEAVERPSVAVPTARA